MKRHYVVCGAAPDTCNLGVSALGNSAVASLSEVDGDALISLLDSKRSIRTTKMTAATGARDVDVQLCGAKYSKKIYQKESFFNIELCSKFCSGLNEISSTLKTASAFLDVSGGDSFTDLYGFKRFNLVNAPKKYALSQGIPLVLLPQTYGPFKDAKVRAEAEGIVGKVSSAWARDKYSFEVLKQLLGKKFDPARHRLGVDMAFGLPATVARSKLDRVSRNWIADDTSVVVGINVSGLILNDPESAKNRYDFIADYASTLAGIVRRLLDDCPNVKVLFIPHVLVPDSEIESDYSASLKLIESMGLTDCDRLNVVKPVLDQCETKWLVGQMDWFMGTRMHATIAALSMCVPVCTLAYSDKALGVFESCGQEKNVFDPRTTSEKDLVEKVVQSYGQRDDIRKELSKSMEAIKEQVKIQMQDIVSMLV